MSILFKYQKKGVRWISHFKGRALLADEMGLGKTLQALWWVKENPEIALPALVVCPAHLKWVWEKEASTKAGMLSRVLNGMTAKKENIKIDLPITIINYKILNAWGKKLRTGGFKTLIIDECHYAKNRSAQRTQMLLALATRFKHIIAISGTPMLNCPAELWPMIHLLYPEVFNDFLAYAARYCKPELKNGKWIYKGAEHLEELHTRLNRHMLIRRRKKDVLKELPDKIRTVVPISVKLTEYKKVRDNFLRWLHENKPSKVHRVKKALVLNKMGYLKRKAMDLKMEAVKKWIDSFLEETDEKLVVFGVHKKVVRGLHDLYPRNSVVLDGSTSPLNKQKAVNSFQHQKKIRLFFGNVIAAGTGITLTASSNVLFAELDWVPANHTQAEDRIHRIGQKNAAQITYIVAKGTIEEMLCELIQKKQNVIADTMDGKNVKNDFNLYDALIHSLEEK